MLPDTLRQKYAQDKRNIGIVKEYVEALKKAGMKKEAGTVIREYMSRCPVVQVEDKETYLLISRFVFNDPYSNVFEHGMYAVKRMKWDREEKKTEGKQARSMGILNGMGGGVSDADEIDKRYEVLLVLSNTLKKEVDKQCAPAYQEGKYRMPVYDTARIEHLEYLLRRGKLLGQEGMRVKVKIAKAIYENALTEAMRDICDAVRLQIDGIRGSYLIGVLEVVAARGISVEAAREAIRTVLVLSREEEEKGVATNYYTVLGHLYQIAGEEENAAKYKKRGEAIEAERMAKYEELIKAFNKNNSGL